MKKKHKNAFVLTMPKKLEGVRTEFRIAGTLNGMVVLSIINDPLFTPKIKEIIIVTESL